MPVDIQIACPCGCPDGYVVNETNQNLGNWRALAVSGDRRMCGICGCICRLTDGVTQIGVVSVATPRIDSLDVTTGPLSGGTTVNISGHGFLHGTLAVKFDGVSATIVGSPTWTSVQVTTPPGRVQLIESGQHQVRLAVTGVSGTFMPGEPLASSSGFGVGFVGSFASGYLYVINYPLNLPAGNVISGVTSGATATVGVVGLDFEVGETATGQTSGATATVLQRYPLRVGPVTGAFTAGEWVLGATSFAKVQLDATTPSSQSAMVTVQNENGIRPLGGRFYSFDYT